LLQVPGQEKYCIEGTALKGSKFQFSEQFKNLKKFFGGHANSTETD
jgi:hypothetical protein